MYKLLITNGPELNPAWTDRIAVSKYYIADGALTLSSAQAAGGLLIDGEAYFYKVVAVMKKKLTISGDTSTQLSALSIDGPAPQKLFWKLTKTGTTVTFVLSRDPSWLEIVASGTRTNNGVLTFTEVNNSRINGAVTVAYTVDDGGNDNIITIEHSTFVGNEETTETIVAGTNTINLSWTAPGGEIDGYRVYRGSTTDCYDGFFALQPNVTTYSDTGEAFMTADEAWMKSDIRLVSEVFLPAGSPQGYAWLPKCQLHVNFNKANRLQIIDLTKVGNHPLWSTGLMPSVFQALNDFNEWL
jgi:hypothetical protein